MTEEFRVGELMLAELCWQGQSVAVITTNGYQMRGRITAFDRHVIVLSGKDGQQMTYQHAISTIIPQQTVELERQTQTAGKLDNTPRIHT